MLHVRFNYWNVRSPLQQFSSHYLVLIIMHWATLAELYGSFSIPTLIWLGSRIYNFQLSIFSSFFFLFERENHPESLSSSSRAAHELKLFSLICKTLWEAPHRAICFVSIIAFWLPCQASPDDTKKFLWFNIPSTWLNQVSYVTS